MIVVATLAKYVGSSSSTIRSTVGQELVNICQDSSISVNTRFYITQRIKSNMRQSLYKPTFKRTNYFVYSQQLPIWPRGATLPRTPRTHRMHTACTPHTHRRRGQGRKRASGEVADHLPAICTHAHHAARRKHHSVSRAGPHGVLVGALDATRDEPR